MFVSFTFPPSYQSSLKLGLNPCLPLVLCLSPPFPSPPVSLILSAVVWFISFAKCKQGLLAVNVINKSRKNL